MKANKDLAATFAEARSSEFIEGLPSELDLRRLYDTYKRFLEAAPSSVQGVFKGEIHVVEKVLVHNAEVRGLVCTIFVQLSALAKGFVPDNAKDAMDEFTVQISQGQPEQSFCMRALVFHEVFAKLKKMSQYDFSGLKLGEDVVLCHGTDLTDQEVRVPASACEETPSKIVSWNSIANIASILEGSLQLAFEDFLKSLQLRAILAQADDWLVVSDLTKGLDSLIDAAHAKKASLSAA